MNEIKHPLPKGTKVRVNVFDVGPPNQGPAFQFVGYIFNTGGEYDVTPQRGGTMKTEDYKQTVRVYLVYEYEVDLRDYPADQQTAEQVAQLDFDTDAAGIILESGPVIERAEFA